MGGVSSEEFACMDYTVDKTVDKDVDKAAATIVLVLVFVKQRNCAYSPVGALEKSCPY